MDLPDLRKIPNLKMLAVRIIGTPAPQRWQIYFGYHMRENSSDFL
jgi:hypothetical protein